MLSWEKIGLRERYENLLRCIDDNYGRKRCIYGLNFVLLGGK